MDSFLASRWPVPPFAGIELVRGVGLAVDGDARRLLWARGVEVRVAEVVVAECCAGESVTRSRERVSLRDTPESDGLGGRVGTARARVEVLTTPPLAAA